MGSTHRFKLPLVLLILQVILIVLFAFLVEYDNTAHTKHSDKGSDGDSIVTYYPMFQDIHVMIFIGFGFLMTFLKRYGFGSIGLNMLVAAIVLQWATIMLGIVHSTDGKIRIEMTTIISADFAAAAVLITFGALLGVISPIQLIVLSVMEISFYALNEWIGVTLLKAVDVGGSMFIHCFGAYFGLAVARVMHNPDVDKSPRHGSMYHSDLFSMVGTIFLWLYWPSFNSALAAGDAQHRAVLNTYYALAACCVVTFAISALVDDEGKLDMVHIQNSTLAGGVAVGTSADLMINPYGAMIIGSVAGLLSVIGFKYIQPWLVRRCWIHDTCGIHNLHGMPAILAGICGAVTASLATFENYGYSLYSLFPARVPAFNESNWEDIVMHYPNLEPGDGRSAGQQAGYQVLALAVTLGIGILGGTLSGLLIRFLSILDSPMGDHLFNDEYYWTIPEDFVRHAPTVYREEHRERIENELAYNPNPTKTGESFDMNHPIE